MSSALHRTRVLAAYRELIRLAKRTTSEQHGQLLGEARQSFRAHQHESDPGKQVDLFKMLSARISFLRTITPRRPGDTSSIGAGHFVLRGEELVEGAGDSAGAR